jgi:hypothetical protein
MQRFELPEVINLVECYLKDILISIPERAHEASYNRGVTADVVLPDSPASFQFFK